MADSMTVLRKAGPPGTKRNIAVLGDGFTAADQAAYNQWVDRRLIKGVFGHDYYSEDASAYNIYRVNLESVDSGVSTRTYDEHGTPSDPSRRHDRVARRIRNTALGIHLQRLLGALLAGVRHEHRGRDPGRDQHVGAGLQRVLVVLNNPNYGGCGGGGRAHVPMGVDWTVIAHEFGHGIGGFADEYSAGAGAYTGGEQGVDQPDHRSPTGRRPSGTSSSPRPRRCPPASAPAANYNQGPRPAGWTATTTSGCSRAAARYDTGIYRPVENCRMNSNTPAVLPGLLHVDQDRTGTARPATTSAAPTPGASSAAAAATCCCTTATSIQLFRADGAGFTHRFSGVERVPGLVAVPAERPGLRRRLQRRRRGRGRHLQRRRLGDPVPRPARLRRQRRAAADRPVRRRHPGLGRLRQERPLPSRRPQRRRQGRPRRRQRRRLVDAVRRAAAQHRQRVLR